MVVLILFLLLNNSGVFLYVSIVLIITKPDTNYFRANRVDSVLEDVVVESEIRLFSSSSLSLFLCRCSVCVITPVVCGCCCCVQISL